MLQFLLHFGLLMLANQSLQSQCNAVALLSRRAPVYIGTVFMIKTEYHPYSVFNKQHIAQCVVYEIAVYTSGDY
jgi:hypothetical protein